ncbi:hypothetical protein TSAR_007555 [Trichomalopsis sarcophagae]|uniref:Uncharacterized protein n=1 Tax=Trichomalopsis sarcophagae TaxID=543379 RepID=A0A232FEA0_9HYME|nr:hypothetical protein TSAR_007555 [Trichomalopsis sarcophagae]
MWGMQMIERTMDSNKMNLKIIIHKIIIEAITIEEEGNKIIMATKVDKQVTIVTTIIGSNNVTIARLGIAMETAEISKYSIANSRKMDVDENSKE